MGPNQESHSLYEDRVSADSRWAVLGHETVLGGHPCPGDIPGADHLGRIRPGTPYPSGTDSYSLQPAPGTPTVDGSPSGGTYGTYPSGSAP